MPPSFTKNLSSAKDKREIESYDFKHLGRKLSVSHLLSLAIQF